MLVTSVAVLACAGAAVADPTATPFEINGELRVRNENDNRDFNSNTDMKSFSLMRTRIGINVHPAADMSVFVQVQDSRVQGQVPSSTTPGVQENGNLDLHQGFFQVNNLGWQGFGIKAGRMEVSFGNERLIAPDAWNNVSTSFDGAMATVNHGRFNGQLLWANLAENDTPSIGSPDFQNKTDATMQAGFGTFGVNDNANVDVYAINERDKGAVTPDDNMDTFTLGGRVHGKAATQFDYSVEGAYQMGSQDTGPSTQNDIGAYMVGGEVGVTLGNEARPVRFGAGVDLLSGDDNGTDNKQKAFNTLFGDNHTFYGLMDVVQPASSSSVASGGLQDIKVNAKATVWSNEYNSFAVGGEFHNFRLAEAGTASNALGNEVDVHGTWAYRERFMPTVGVSAFMPGDAVPAPVGSTKADNSYWFYAQGTVSF